MTDTTTTLGSDTVQALETAWAHIRANHPDVMEHVVFRLGSGRAGRRGGLVLGSITTTGNWEANRREGREYKTDPQRYHEVFIAGETLAQHPVKLLETLIHEAVHSANMTRGVKDVSRQNRYHNKRFRAACEEFGLEWTHLAYQTEKDEDGNLRFIPNPDHKEDEPQNLKTNPRYLTKEAPADEVIGFSDMHISETTARKYSATVALLDRDVQVQLGRDRVKFHAPKRRRTVVMFPASRQDALGLVSKEEVLALTTDQPEDPQRIGVVVYDGLLRRDLLAPHHAYIEEV